MSLRNASLMLALAACSGPGTPPTTTTTTTTTGSGSQTASAPIDAAVVEDPNPLPTPLPVSNAQSVKVTLADVGLEASSIDRTSDPCIDFYQFACGGWLAANKIPDDRARWARFAEIDDKNKTTIKTILEEAAKGIGADAATKKLGDFYASCMDAAAIEQAGMTPAKPMLDRLAKVKDPKSWLAAVIELHKLGQWVVWSDQVLADFKDSATNLTYLDSAGLGLPDRDYYVKADFKDKLAAYKTHVGKMLVHAGLAQPAAERAAADVVAIETELAKVSMTATERRDLQAAYNPTDEKGLARSVKSVDWKAYWKGMGITPSKKLVNTAPKYFAAFDRIRAKFKYPQWASYFTYHFLAGSAFALPKQIDEESFELARVLTGVEKQRDRSKRCIDATERALGELIGQQYVLKHFPATSKQTATMLVDALVKVMGEEIGKLEWMSDGTKTTAKAKLAKLVRKIGFPEKFRTYDFEVKRDDFAGNVMRSSAFETRRQLVRAGKPVDRSEWLMNAYTADAYYDPTSNTTALPAGILQPPFFGQDRTVAANLGGIGMVIGHELTHGFDDQGAQFDADGNLKNWWHADDERKFGERGQCVVDQYSAFEAAPKQFINGKLTLGENIADMGGVKMAFQAYRSLRKDAAKVYSADGFDEDQQFFLAVGQAWCSKERPAELQRRLTTDPHSPPKFRVYGSLRNLPDFAQAFKCAPGTPMRPAKTCTVW